MRKLLFASLTTLFFSGSLAVAQTPALPNPVPLGETAPTTASGSVFQEPSAPGGTTWASGEFLLWWVKSAPISVPLATTVGPGGLPSTSALSGALGAPGAIVVSPNQLNYGPFIGGRVTVGSWLDADGRFGVEGSGFLMETRVASSSFVSNGAGVPDVRAVFINPTSASGFPVGEAPFFLASPGFANGGQIITSSTSLWGAEANGLFRATNDGALGLSFLGGFRYLNLQERLSIQDTETFAPFGTFAATDAFGTRNQFYGGQLGAKVKARLGSFFGSIVGKAALGVDHESVTVNGVSSVTTFGGPTAITGGGLFAQGTNIGRQTRDEFAVVPAVQMQVGMDLTSNIRVFGGYDFLYISNVARPGDQIDRVLNLTQNPTIIGAPSTLIGPARPTPLFNNTDFWAHGVSAGVQISF